ncbi:hypothetical protein KAI19_01810 [bacterium]|nr:hypothetical protein [bacterium]
MGTNDQTKLNDLETKVNDLHRHFEDQLKSRRRSRTMSLILGIVFVAVVTIYFSWISATVKELVEPEGLAEILYSRIQQNLPAATEKVEKILKDNAPIYADKMEAKVMECLPLVRVGIEKEVDKLVDTGITTTSTHATVVLNRFITENKTELDKAMKAAKSLEDEEYAEKLLEVYANEYLLAALDKALIESIGHDIDTVVDVAGKSLESIRDQLLVLQEGKDLTHQQESQRRLIKLIIKYLQEPVTS